MVRELILSYRWANRVTAFVVGVFLAVCLAMPDRAAADPGDAAVTGTEAKTGWLDYFRLPFLSISASMHLNRADEYLSEKKADQAGKALASAREALHKFIHIANTRKEHPLKDAERALSSAKKLLEDEKLDQARSEVQKAKKMVDDQFGLKKKSEDNSTSDLAKETERFLTAVMDLVPYEPLYSAMDPFMRMIKHDASAT
jgi:hypothetical protein